MKRTDADSPTPPITGDADAPQDPKQTQLESIRQLRVGQALFETTWRIAVPVVIGTGLGIFLDLRVGTRPWLTFLGVVIGFVLACALIARLLKESEKL